MSTNRPFTINDEFAPIFEARAAELAEQAAQRQAAADQREEIRQAGIAAIGAALDNATSPTGHTPTPTPDEPLNDNFLADMIKENNR